MNKLLLLGVMAVLVAGCSNQGQVASTISYPSSYTISELPSDLRAFTITYTGNTGYSAIWSASFPHLLFLGDVKQTQYAYVFWTNGAEAIDVQGGKCLVAYTAADEFEHISDLLHDKRLTDPSLPLKQRLIPEKEILSLTPRPELTKSGWLALIEGKPIPDKESNEPGQQQAGPRYALVAQLIDGSLGPAQYKVKDLPADLRANYSIPYTDRLMNLPGHGVTDQKQDPDNWSECITALWSNGKEIGDGQGGRFWVTYTAAPQRVDALAAESLATGGASISTACIQPRLMLVRKSEGQRLIPRPDLTKTVWLKRLAGAKNDNVKDQALANLNVIQMLVLRDSAEPGVILPAKSTPEAKVAIAKLLKRSGSPGLYPWIDTTALFESRNPRGGELCFNTNLAGAPRNDASKAILWYDDKAWPDGQHLVACLGAYDPKFIDEKTWQRARVSLTKKYK